jgi:hypothetical protein
VAQVAQVQQPLFVARGEGLCAMRRGGGAGPVAQPAGPAPRGQEGLGTRAKRASAP